MPPRIQPKISYDGLMHGLAGLRQSPPIELVTIGPVNIRSPTELLEHPNEPSIDIDLALLDSMSRPTREGVVQIVP